MEKSVEYYMGLPYTIELQRDSEAGWFVRVKELRGCMSEGDTAEEAIEMIQEAMELWLEVALEDDISIPEPRPDEDYSGKFVVRVPRSLHRELVDEAQQQGTSLNQYINVALARSVGRPVSVEPVAEETGWPGMRASVHRVLSAAGLAEEAGELDERLFAGWADQCLDQVESALQSGLVRDALWCLEALAQGLRAGRDKSPVVAAFCRTVSLLYQQVETNVHLRQGVINDMIVRSKIAQRVEGANEPLAQMVIQEERVAYSETSTERLGRIERLFERPGRGSQW